MKKIKSHIILVVTLSIIFFCAKSYADNVLIDANQQSYDGKTNVTTFQGNVKVGFNNIKVSSPKAFVKMGTAGKPEMANFVGNPYAIKQDGTSKTEVKSNVMRMSLLDGRMFAEGNSKALVTQNNVPVLSIKATNQEFDMNNNVIKATGHVVINYKDLSTNSSSAIITINPQGQPDKVNLNGAVKIVQGKSIINADNVVYTTENSEMVAMGHVKSKSILQDGTPVVMLSNFQQYAKADSTLLSSGDVKVSYKDYYATGPKALFVTENNASSPNKIIFVGRSRIKESTRQVDADKIEITINPKHFNAEGNVKTKFVQVQTPSKLSKSSPKSKDKKNQAREKSLTNKSNKSKSPDLNNVNSFESRMDSSVKNENIPEIKDPVEQK